MVQNLSMFSGDDDGRRLAYPNAPDLNEVAGAAFKGIEIARGALLLYSVETHFYAAVWAEK
jgi:hypothetical protein